LGEYPDLEKVIEVVEAIKLHGVTAVKGFIDHWSLEDLAHFDEAFQGTFDSFKEFAEDYAEDCILVDCPEHIKNYIDYEQIEQELSFSYMECEAENYKVHIFNKDW